jgi:glutamyl-tRNA reductase
MDDGEVGLDVLKSAMRAGATAIVECPGLERSGALGSLLATLVRRGRRAAREQDPREPLLAGASAGDARRWVARLMMVGGSVRGALGAGDGPALIYCTGEQFLKLKRPHGEALELLRRSRGEDVTADCWLWNTCNRFEMYGFAPETGVGTPRLAHSLHATGEAMGRLLPGEAPLNALRGRDALRHALRTAAGLNSVLAGDGEVLEQLRSCIRAAEHAGTSEAGTRWLASELEESASRVRKETAWRGFEHRYCRVVLEGLAARGLMVPGHGTAPSEPRSSARVVVIGGSTTSASVLEVLAGMAGFERAERTLIYRGQRSGVLAKRLSAAAESGNVIRVETYDDPAVMAEIARADVLILAADQREPIVNGTALAGSRYLRVRGLTVVDFNTFGSVAGAMGIDGLRVIGTAELDEEVARFNKTMLALPAFEAARREAELWIERRVRELCDGGEA